MRPSLLAYHFPHWHRDPHNDRWHGAGWTEWELVRANPARFVGHTPLRPAWGCHDEADPAQMAREIDLAADHGIDAFLFDTYWYEEGPFLDRVIREGFLKAPNRSRLRFACMWANHTWRNWHPAQATQDPWKDAALLDEKISPGSWRRFAERVADWMALPEYFRIGDRPYFSIYRLQAWLDTCATPEVAAAELAWFRALVRQRAGADPHLGLVWTRLRGGGLPSAELCAQLGFDSITPYNICDHHPVWLDSFPVASWEAPDRANRAAWVVRESATGLPYIPNLTTGWDSSARCVTTDRWERRAYPWYPVLPPDPERFRRELLALRDWFARSPDALPVATINAWNEWTEGAVLLPTESGGQALLGGVRSVFGLR